MSGRQEPASRSCPKCGERLLVKNRVFCPSCGVNVFEYAPSNNAAETSEEIAPERKIPDQPAEVLKELLRETLVLDTLIAGFRF